MELVSNRVKKVKILSFRNVIYLKRKQRTCTIQIQVKKVWFFGNFFFKLFDLSWSKIFSVEIFETFLMVFVRPGKCRKKQSYKK